jgi:2-amino-4-hydroxy-6-hydroxymethyldihydropteridine diphosphokinase
VNRAAISLGSNIEPYRNVARALEHLSGACRLVARSDLEVTRPIGIEDQPDFVNGAVLIETDLDAASLRARLKGIEDRLGRDRSAAKFGPRTIDLDIVVWNGRVIDDDVYERDFLRRLVAQVCPAALKRPGPPAANGDGPARDPG